jgi:tetratricopeptide (TPR) repeat protein
MGWVVFIHSDRIRSAEKTSTKSRNAGRYLKERGREVMGTSRTGKENTVIIFFALVLVAVIVMAVINPKSPKDDHSHDEPGQSASLEEEIAEAKKRVESAPNNVNALIQLGDLYMDSKQMKNAINIFNKVLAIEPENAHALADLGAVYQQSGLYDKSLEAFEKLLEIESENIPALYNLGMLNRYYKKDNKEALKYLEKIPLKGLDPSLIQALQNEIDAIKAEMK